VSEHMVILWLSGEGDTSTADWEKISFDNGFDLEHKSVKTYPWSDVHHEVTWWITRPLTIDEWCDLDAAESEVLSRIVGNDDFCGTAGPIPFSDTESDAR